MHLYNNSMQQKMKPDVTGRVVWLDVARAFGIYAIYLGHFGRQQVQRTVLHFSFMFRCSFSLQDAQKSIIEKNQY